LASLFYDTGLSNHASAVNATFEVVPHDHVVFGTDWPYAALPPTGDPAPDLTGLGDRRTAIDGSNAAALVPRLIR
jgi:predicted TIM-barrel fold metal-dependent hydrolase